MKTLRKVTKVVKNTNLINIQKAIDNLDTNTKIMNREHDSINMSNKQNSINRADLLYCEKKLTTSIHQLTINKIPLDIIHLIVEYLVERRNNALLYVIKSRQTYKKNILDMVDILDINMN